MTLAEFRRLGGGMLEEKVLADLEDLLIWAADGPCECDVFGDMCIAHTAGRLLESGLLGLLRQGIDATEEGSV